MKFLSVLQGLSRIRSSSFGALGIGFFSLCFLLEQKGGGGIAGKFWRSFEIRQESSIFLRFSQDNSLIRLVCFDSTCSWLIKILNDSLRLCAILWLVNWHANIFRVFFRFVVSYLQPHVCVYIVTICWLHICVINADRNVQRRRFWMNDWNNETLYFLIIRFFSSRDKNTVNLAVKAPPLPPPPRPLPLLVTFTFW